MDRIVGDDPAGVDRIVGNDPAGVDLIVGDDGERCHECQQEVLDGDWAVSYDSQREDQDMYFVPHYFRGDCRTAMMSTMLLAKDGCLSL